MESERTYLLILLSILMIYNVDSACSAERCCLVTTCTSSYCSQKNTETWISTQNFANYQYTKLVMANGSCVPCAYNCQTCASQTTCSTCASGYYKSNNDCLPCSYSCSTCIVSNAISKCSACSGATFLDATSATCKSCPTGSSSCASATVIAQCLSGYFLTSNSMFCLSCPSNCQSCPSSNTVCASCSLGYYLNSSSCYQCVIPDCLACSLISGKVICTSCSSGKQLKNGSCSSCPTNCNTCSSSTVCTVCSSGYYLLGGGCLAATLIPNCASYSSFTVCSSCSSGYYLSSGACWPCSVLCSTCYGIHYGACTACVSGATLFNQMCILNKHVNSLTAQYYYSFPHATALATGAVADCNRFLYAGTLIKLVVNNLAASKLTIRWRLFSRGGSTTYNVGLTNLGGNQALSYQTDSSQSWPLCSTNSSQPYFLGRGEVNFSSIKVANQLSFSTDNGMVLAVQQMVVVAQLCSSLCVECSSTVCSQCLMDNLYTQDAYCVYTCSSGYYILLNSSSSTNPKRCLAQCPPGTYPLPTNLTCANCQSPCLTCLNDNFCLSCISDYFLTPNNTCSQLCPYRYFGELLTQTCQKCAGRCNECIDQKRCLNCNTGFYYATNYSCVDACSPSQGITGQYADLDLMKCMPCDATCLNCLYSADHCTECPINSYFFNNTCLSSCPSGYYSNSAKVCLACSYPCENCLSSINCVSCVDRYLLNSSCLTDCPAGYYEDNSALTCTVCASGCAQCVGKATECTECLSGYFLFNETCVTSCPPQYYGNSTTHTCLACQGFCYTCATDNFCSTCRTNFLSNLSCVPSPDCPNTHYADIVQLKCLPCSSPCLSCEQSATKCTKCSLGLYLQNGTCVSNCSSGNYPGTVNTIAVCVGCSSPCQTCLNVTYCLTCVAGYRLSAGLCSTTCGAGFYFNATIDDCASCGANCLVCKGSGFCQLCENSYYVRQLSSISNQCVASCPANMYANTLSSSCQACLYPCGNCSSSLDCITCQEGALYLSRCLSSCPDSTFLNTTGQMCSPCGGFCLTCTRSATNCLTCLSTYYLDATTSSCVKICPSGTYPQNVTQLCLQCAPDCMSCLNATYCLICNSSSSFLLPSAHTCTSQCPPGSFGNISAITCDSCISPCLTCAESATHCRSCIDSYVLLRLGVSSFSCVVSCPSGFYKQGQNCYQCIFPCQDCSSAAHCLSCVSGTYLYPSSGACLLSCPPNSYLVSASQLCQSCSSSCKSCRNATYCLSCYSNYTLLSGQCLTSCPAQYYSETGMCSQCFGLCRTCSSKYYCLSCLTGYLSNGFCYSTCPPGTYANLTLSQCLPCSSPCVECAFSSTTCTRCPSGLRQHAGGCVSMCPNGTWASTERCISCTFPCIICIGQGQCSECLGGYLLYNGLTCINDTLYCPNDFYKMDGKYCIPRQQCPVTYYADTDLHTCGASCPQSKYSDPDTSTCLYSCHSYQYAGVSLICHNFSTSPPSSLMGMSAIVFIKSSIVHVVVQFNQTVTWQNSRTDMYTVKERSVGRLLGESINYSPDTTDPTLLLLRVRSLPSEVELQLPAYNLVASETGLPLQTANISVKLPSYVAYDYGQIYQGRTAKQFGEGLSWFIYLLSIFFLFKNRLSHLYILWDTTQLLYLLLFLDIQYPPALNDFLLGLSPTLLIPFPSFFSTQLTRTRSDNPFYAYSYDNSFIRNAGPSITLLFAVFFFYLCLKLCELLAKKVEAIGNCLNNWPQLKRGLYELLLRFRWHYASDVMFLTFPSVLLFAVAELYHIGSNPNRSLSNAVCILSLCLYLVFPIFVAIKLQRHYPNISKGKHVENLRCFYRGIQKTSKFGVFLMVVRYFRKVVFALTIGIFSSQPMYALPLLMSACLLMALFICLHLPFKKRLSNVVQALNQATLALVCLLLAVVNFNNQNDSTSLNVLLGYLTAGILIFLILLLVFEVFSKTLFQLQPQNRISADKNEPIALNEQQLRAKAAAFFDYMFPRIREQFGFGEDSDDEVYHYQEGDSQNSENNEQREKEWGIQSSETHSQEFRHYDNNSESAPTEPKQQPPEYLIRCIKELQ